MHEQRTSFVQSVKALTLDICASAHMSNQVSYCMWTSCGKHNVHTYISSIILYTVNTNFHYTNLLQTWSRTQVRDRVRDRCAKCRRQVAHLFWSPRLGPRPGSWPGPRQVRVMEIDLKQTSELKTINVRHFSILSVTYYSYGDSIDFFAVIVYVLSETYQYEMSYT